MQYLNSVALEHRWRKPQFELCGDTLRDITIPIIMIGWAVGDSWSSGQ